jgi:hypothetical protein
VSADDWVSAPAVEEEEDERVFGEVARAFAGVARVFAEVEVEEGLLGPRRRPALASAAVDWTDVAEMGMPPRRVPAVRRCRWSPFAQFVPVTGIETTWRVATGWPTRIDRA